MYHEDRIGNSWSRQPRGEYMYDITAAFNSPSPVFQRVMGLDSVQAKTRNIRPYNRYVYEV